MVVLSAPRATWIGQWRYLVLPLVVSVLFFVDRNVDGDYDVSYAARVARGLVDSCGVRVIGTAANEVCAVDYLMQTLKDAQLINPAITSEVFTTSNGSYYLTFVGGINVAYDQLHNVVVRVPGVPRVPFEEGKNTTCSLLVSAHFDSHFGSPGLSDDTAQIGLMADFVRQLASSPLPVDVVFNFNGGEELICPASHGFITQHPNAHTICGFINLESMGPTGREAAYQVSSEWVARSYAAAAIRPNIQSVSSLVFGSGVVPAESDYRIYRDFWREGEQLHGIDFATTGDGSRYHTARDAVLDEKSLRHYGSNVYRLMRQMAEDLYDQKHQEGSGIDHVAVFDILGLKTFVIPTNVFVALVVLSAMHTIWDILQKRPKNLLWTHVTGPLAAVILSVVVSWIPMAVQMLLHANGTYTTQVFVQWGHILRPLFLLYPLVTVMFLLGCPTYLPRSPPLIYHGLFLLAATLRFSLVSGLYPLALLLGIPSCGILVALTPLAWLLLTSFVSDFGGRSATWIPFQFIFLCFSSFSVSVVLATVAQCGYIHSCGIRTWRRYGTIIALTSAAILAIVCTLPNYSVETPQHFYIQRVLDENRGTGWFYWVQATDFNLMGVLDKHGLVPENTWEPDSVRMINGSLYADGLPYPMPAAHIFTNGAVAPGQGKFSSHLHLATNSYTVIEGGLRITVDLHDATMLVLVLPSTIRGWSFAHPVPPPHQFCQCHYFMYGNGGLDKASRRLDLNITGDVPRVDIAAFYMDSDKKLENWTRVPEDLPLEIPDWMTVIFFHSHRMTSYVGV